MKKSLPILAILALLITWQSSCIDPPKYDKVPEISNITVSKTTLKPGVDSIFIQFDFTDGDGDLGSKTGDSLVTLYRTDMRTNYVYPEYIPFLNLKGTIDDVSGSVIVTVPAADYSCLFNPVEETLQYEIYIVDRAGNASNKLQTPEMTLKCQ